MKTKLLSAGLLLLAITGTAKAENIAEVGVVPPPVQVEVERLMQRYKVPGLAIAGIEAGEVRWIGVFGERAPGEVLSRDTIFNVASLTKPLFATMAMHLVARDQLGLDASLAPHWIDPDVAEDPRHRSITPRIALSHQSGFRNWRGSRTLEFIFDPGSRHEYSGEGFEYLRLALESKTGSTMAELMQRHVLAPAGMTNTSFGWNDTMRPRMTRRFDETTKLVDMGDDKRSANAAANTFTTIDDYARFTAWVANGAGLPKALFEAMSSPQALHENPAEEFGLGWKLAHVDGHAVLMHDGREAGIRTQVVVFPQSRDALVVLTNSSNGELIVRPIIQTVLPQGNALVADLDRLVWQYVHRMPNEQIAPLSAGITRSPTYTSTLLHAANTMLIQTSPLTAGEKRSASAAVDDFVLSLFSGELSADAANTVVAQLISNEGEQAAFRTRFDIDQARAWLAALRSPPTTAN